MFHRNSIDFHGFSPHVPRIAQAQALLAQLTVVLRSAVARFAQRPLPRAAQMWLGFMGHHGTDGGMGQYL
jgi:hypothetical protein